MKHEEKKPSYVCVILRKDGEHIAVLESTDYDKVYDEYTRITTEWTRCVKENIPFSLKSPIVTTFDPGLIYEIKLNPVVETTASSRNDNPYAKQMQRNGLSAMHPFTGENLDQGYR
jgi:hypothetical protein